MLTFIWAEDENGYIGKDNKMPWHLPDDLQFFKRQTSGKIIVLGRKTYDSLGKALPNRTNLVLTRDKHLKLMDAEVIHDKETILARAQTEEVVICGGAEIYRLFTPFVDRLIVTKIYATFDADTRFPPLDWSLFEEVSRERRRSDQKNKYDHDFVIYMKK